MRKEEHKSIFNRTLAIILLINILAMMFPLTIPAYDRRTPVVEAVQKVLPTIINISTRSTQTVYRPSPLDELFSNPFTPYGSPFGKRETYQVEGMGSGVIIEGGYIVTNNHVITTDAGSAASVVETIFVTLYDEKQPRQAVVIGADPKADVAILQVEGASPTRYLPWGRSDDLMIGETVIGIGNALGQPFTVTSGIISALNRTIVTDDGNRLFNLIQTDADINRGNSGGPLVNINGEFIGLNTAIISPSGGSVGVGLAIPVTRVKKVYDYWIHNVLSLEDRMGVEIQEMDTYMQNHFYRFYPDLRSETLKGVVVLEISPGGLCDGLLLSADILCKINNHPIENITDLRSRLEEHTGTELSVEILREGKRQTVSIPVPETELVRVQWMGMEIQEIDNPYRRWFGINENYEGLIVHSITDEERAPALGFKRGDVIVGINRQRIRSLADLEEVRKQTKGATEILVDLVRKVSKNDWKQGTVRIQPSYF